MFRVSMTVICQACACLCLVMKRPLGRFHTRHSCKRARLWRFTIISTCLLISHTMRWWWGQVEEFRV